MKEVEITGTMTLKWQQQIGAMCMLLPGTTRAKECVPGVIKLEMKQYYILTYSL